MTAGDWKDMFRAAEAGDAGLVRYHLDLGVDPDFVHAEFQSTALVAAILAGQRETARVLLERGASPRLVSPLEGLDPLTAARQTGDAVLAALLERQAPRS